MNVVLGLFAVAARRVAPLLCAGAALLAVPAFAQRHKPKEEKSTRIRVAVVQFVGRYQGSNENVLDAASSAVSHISRFQLIDRARLPEILQELKLQSGGVIDASTQKQIGKIKGIDYIIYGAVNEANVTQSQSNSKDYFGNVTRKVTHKARLKMTFRATNIETGETSVETYHAETVGGEDAQEVLGKALEKVCKQMAAGLIDSPEKQNIKVAKIDPEDGEVTINSGRDNGVDMGQIYKIFIPAGSDSSEGDSDDALVSYARPVAIHPRTAELELIEWGKTGFGGVKEGWRKRNAEQQMDKDKLEKFNHGKKKRDRRRLIETGQSVALAPDGKPEE